MGEAGRRGHVDDPRGVRPLHARGHRQVGARREDLGGQARPMTTLNFVSAGAAQGLVAKVAHADGVEVAGSFGAVGAMLEKFLAGEACDVVILTRAQIDALAAKAAVVAGTPGDPGASATAITGRAGPALPAVRDASTLRQARPSAAPACCPP